MVFAHDGRVVGSAQKEFPQILPSPGHVEHNPDEIWESQLAVAQEALAQGKPVNWVAAAVILAVWLALAALAALAIVRAVQNRTAGS